MTLELTDQERAVLEEIVRGAYSTLREEIYKAETSDFKRMLKEREQVVIGLLGKLGASIPGVTA